MPDGGFGEDKTEQVPQYIFRPLKIPKTGRALEDAHGKEQDKQAVAHAHEGVVDAQDKGPYTPALEALGGLGQQGPYLGELVVPAREGVFKVADYPVVTYIKFTSL